MTEEEELAHFGVKGMKWGVRKAPEQQNRRYGAEKRESDQRHYGKGGVKRINRRLNKGQSYRKAVAKEIVISGLKEATIKTGFFAVPLILAVVGNSASNGSIAARAATNRGRASAANTMGLPVSNIQRPKVSRNGVYNITTM